MSAQEGPYARQSLRLVRLLGGLVPINTWFGPSEVRKVVVQAFRVYRATYANTPELPHAPLVLDFELVRAVFGRSTGLLYPDPEALHLYPTPDGGFQKLPNRVVWEGPTVDHFRHLTDEETWQSTGDSLVLFLFTPSSSQLDIDMPVPHRSSIVREPAENDPAIRERLVMARAAIVAVMGRNAAFEELFEVLLQFDDRGGARVDRLSSPRISPTTFDPPKLDGFSAELAARVFKSIQRLDADTRNRISLALRWYLLAQRHPLAKEDSDVDIFLSYWVAFESLVGPNKAVASARRLLRDIHGLHAYSNQEIEDKLFPIGRIFNLRGRIVHQGHVPEEISYLLLNFMSDLFVDVLLSTLDLPSLRKTSVYMDGSAIDFLPKE